MSTRDDPLAGLLARLGLQSAKPDQNGLITLFVDQHLPVMMGSDAERVYLYAGIGAIEDCCRPDASRWLLEGGHKMFEQDGFALGVPPDTGLVFLLARARLAALADDDLFQLFDRFVDAADVWHKKLRTGLPAEEEEGPRETVAWAGRQSPFPDQMV